MRRDPIGSLDGEIVRLIGCHLANGSTGVAAIRRHSWNDTALVIELPEGVGGALVLPRSIFSVGQEGYEPPDFSELLKSGANYDAGI